MKLVSKVSLLSVQNRQKPDATDTRRHATSRPMAPVALVGLVVFYFFFRPAARRIELLLMFTQGMFSSLALSFQKVGNLGAQDTVKQFGLIGHSVRP